MIQKFELHLEVLQHNIHPWLENQLYIVFDIKIFTLI